MGRRPKGVRVLRRKKNPAERPRENEERERKHE